MTPFQCLSDGIEAEGAAALVRIAAAEGSVPREKNAWLAVRPSGQFHGTIGGGALEWNAIAHARAALQNKTSFFERQTIALGPSLGQCCGGRVVLSFEYFYPTDHIALDDLMAISANSAFYAFLGSDRRIHRKKMVDESGQYEGGWIEDYTEQATEVLLFGSGHVGQAIVMALAPLPFSIQWIETRHQAFPAHVPRNVRCIETESPDSVIGSARTGAVVLIMTHSHAIDLVIAHAALAQNKFSYIGLIGSKTKRARFLSQMRNAGLMAWQAEKLVCPIGLPELRGKEPPIIAASVAADLLLRRHNKREIDHEK